MRQQLEGKSTTKPAYTLECKVNRLAWIEGRFDSDGRYWYGSPPGERFESSPNHKDVPPLPNNRDDRLERQSNLVRWQNWLLDLTYYGEYCFDTINQLSGKHTGSNPVLTTFLSGVFNNRMRYRCTRWMYLPSIRELASFRWLNRCNRWLMERHQN